MLHHLKAHWIHQSPTATSCLRAYRVRTPDCGAKSAYMNRQSCDITASSTKQLTNLSRTYGRTLRTPPVASILRSLPLAPSRTASLRPSAGQARRAESKRAQGLLSCGAAEGRKVSCCDRPSKIPSFDLCPRAVSGRDRRLIRYGSCTLPSTSQARRPTKAAQAHRDIVQSEAASSLRPGSVGSSQPQGCRQLMLHPQ